MGAWLTGLVAIATSLSPVAVRAQDMNFIVFFDSGSADLSAPMRGVLDNLAASLTPDGWSAIILGAADRAGGSLANFRLGCRRARAVRAYLVSRGIPANRLAVQSAGEDAPMEDTADGVAEVQNRNVTFTVTEHPPTAADGAGIAHCLPFPSLLAPSWLRR